MSTFYFIVDRVGLMMLLMRLLPKKKPKRQSKLPNMPVVIVKEMCPCSCFCIMAVKLADLSLSQKAKLTEKKLIS